MTMEYKLRLCSEIPLLASVQEAFYGKGAADKGLSYKDLLAQENREVRRTTECKGIQWFTYAQFQWLTYAQLRQSFSIDKKEPGTECDKMEFKNEL